MTNFRINSDGKLMETSKSEKHSWVDVRDPAKDELALLESGYGILAEHIQDILDIDEQARIEKEDEYTLLIVRLPVHDPEAELAYFTVPCGILLFPDRIITLCQRNCEVLDELRTGKARSLDIKNKSAFVLHLMGRAAIVYLRYLKDINRSTAIIEKELQVSIKNHELTQLLSIEKSLVFFTTSLKSNEILLEKLQASKSMRFKDDETELLEDVVTDNRQAIEMANIYSDILAGMMDAFASVISNNLNIVMKRLTFISIVLMIPTLVVSTFGMNVTVPLEGKPSAFWIILGVCAGAALIGGFLLRDRPAKPKRRRRKTAALTAPTATGIVARR